MPDYPIDSPLSITASVAGILTFLAAILATLYVRWTYLQNADSEYFSVKTSLSWYKTESTFLQDLIQSTSSVSTFNLNGSGSGTRSDEKGGGREGVEREMFLSVLDQLIALEARILEKLTEAEESAAKMERDSEGRWKKWTVIPGGLMAENGIAISWLGVRAKALELVRQRDALGNRVLFAQMSVISSTVREQEARARKEEEGSRDRLEKLEAVAYAQHEKLDRLEDLVYRVLHRDRVLSEHLGISRSPTYGETPADESTPKVLASSDSKNIIPST